MKSREKTTIIIQHLQKQKQNNFDQDRLTDCNQADIEA